MKLRNPSTNTQIDDCVSYFLAHDHKEQARSTEGLDVNLTDALKLPLDSKNLAIILYHAAWGAMVVETYGRPEQARLVIEKHASPWIDRAVRQTHPIPFTIPHCLVAFDMLGLRPNQKYLDYVEKMGPLVIPRWTRSDLCSAWAAMGNLGLTFSKPFMNAMLKRTRDEAKNFSGKGLSNLLHEMAMVDAAAYFQQGQDRADIGSVYKHIFGLHGLNGRPYYTDHAQKPRKLLDSYYWFNGRDLQDIPADRYQRSGFEFKVKQDIKAAGGSIVSAQFAERVVHNQIDLAVAYHGDEFLVQCDGPCHHVREVGTGVILNDGSTILQSAILKKRMPEAKLVRFPGEVDEQAEVNLWVDALPRIFSAASGSYVMGYDGSLLSPTDRLDRDAQPRSADKAAGFPAAHHN